MMVKTGCIDRYCNGPKVCTEVVENTTDQYMCDAKWCSFHPKYIEEEDND